MKILGLSGWHEGGHAASAVLVEDGVPVMLIEQERVNRDKNAEDQPPHAAIRELLARTGTAWSEIDLVTHGFDIDAAYATVERAAPSILDALVPADLLNEWRPAFSKVGHHLAHAASGFFASDFDAATVIVVDGTGEDVATSVFHAQGTEIERLYGNSTAESLGFYYQSATFAAGFNGSAAGKLMGLASYGDPAFVVPGFELTERSYRLSAAADPRTQRFPGQNFAKDLEPVLRWWGDQFSAVCDRTRDPVDNRDFAAGIQAELERVLLHLFRAAVDITGEPRVVFAGGVALNCAFNGRLWDSGIVDELFVPPVAADSGVGLGAALAESVAARGKRDWVMRHAYLGTWFNEEEIAVALRAAGVRYRQLTEGALVDEIVARLDQGEIVGWFQGPAEVGPRALGARSLLADPRNVGMRDHVNLVKGRELWRPLAPSVLADRLPEFFSEGPSDYMLRAARVHPEKAKEVPAVVHVDGTARPQAVSQDNPLFANLLQRWSVVSGVPVLLNTSFNLAGEPIVHSPTDALNSFLRSRIDTLAIGPFVVSKMDQ